MNARHRITLSPSGHHFEADGTETLLQSALDAGFTLPYGCRDGACGSCKGKVLAGQVDHGKYQPSALPEVERNAGMTLFCCAKPLSDLTLECREVSAAKDIPIKILPCRVQKMERVASDVMVVSLKLPTNERLAFLAGQYVEFMLKDGARRAFSLANAPYQDDVLQLHIRQVPGGEFTGHVFNTMKERDILRIQGPFGSFFLREESDKPMILLAGGTGFAPIMSLVENALHHGVKRPMKVYWGSRNQEGLYLDAVPRRWAAEHTNVDYIPVLSDIPADDPWAGRRGFVHEAVAADHPDLSGWQVYACGAPVMIDAARQAFTQRGLPGEEFFADSFTFQSAAAS